MTKCELYELLQEITGGNFDELELTVEEGSVTITFYDIED